MAGIGWKLERLMARDSLSSTLQAYLTGVAVTSAPWLLTTAVLTLIRTLGKDRADLALVEQLVTMVYAVTLVLSAPIHIVVSRYAADRLFERRIDLVAAPLRRALCFTLLGFLPVGAAVMAILGAPLEVAVVGVLLTSIVAAQWLLLALGGGTSSPGGLLRAFALGAAISMVAALLLERQLGARGYMVGYTLGQAIALAGMLYQVLSDLPGAESPAPPRALRAALREYHLLAISAVAIHAAIWVDKLVTWAIAGGREASTLSTTTSLAWCAVIPAFAWIYLEVETSFYKVFRRYFRGIDGDAAIDAIGEAAVDIRVETMRLLRGAAVVQLVVFGVAVLAAPQVVTLLALPPGSTLALCSSLVAASFQVITLLCLLILYYLDLRHAAVRIAVVELVAIGGATALALTLGATPALGTALGSIAPTVYAILVVRGSIKRLLPDTFQCQPYGVPLA